MTGVAAEWAVHRAEPQPRTIRPAKAVCRLTIVINDRNYVVEPIPAEASAAVKAYRLSKTDGTDYDVAEHVFSACEGNAGDGDSPPRFALSNKERGRRYITCDCPDFIFRRDGIDPEGCKHIKAMVAYGLLDSKGVAR